MHVATAQLGQAVCVYSQVAESAPEWSQRRPPHPCACLVNVERCSTDRRGMRILWTGGAKCPLLLLPVAPPSRTPRSRPDSRHVLSWLGRVAREIAKLKQFSSLLILRPNVTIRYTVPCRMSLGVARATVTSGVGQIERPLRHPPAVHCGSIPAV